MMPWLKAAVSVLASAMLLLIVTADLVMWAQVFIALNHYFPIAFKVVSSIGLFVGLTALIRYAFF